MNRYEPTTPRAAFGVAAAVLTAITMGVFVVLPAKFDSVADPDALAAATRAPVEVASSSARIDAPAVVTRQEYVYPDRATLGTQEIRGIRHKSSSRPTI